MSWKTRVGALASALIVSGCANLATVAPPVTAAMVGAGGGATAETLDAGRQIFTRQCIACHSADPVAKYSFVEWHRIVAEMSERTRLTAAQESALLAYLRAAPQVAPPAP